MAVTRNNRGNGYNSTGTLILNFYEAAWGNVFSTCSIFDTLSSEPLLVSDNWSIDNSGGNQAGTIGSNISIAFRDAVSAAYPNVDIDLYLSGTLPARFPEAAGGSIVITLTDFRLFGGAQFGNGCKSSGELLPNSKLTMVRTQ